MTDFLFLQYFPPSLPSLFCHNRTEQEQRPRCMSPGRLRHGPESTAVFHIKPKNTWDSLLLSLRVCISSRESPFSTQRSSLPHKCLNNCLPLWIHSPLAGQGLEDWNWGAGHVFLVVKPLWWHMWDIEYKWKEKCHGTKHSNYDTLSKHKVPLNQTKNKKLKQG